MQQKRAIVTIARTSSLQLVYLVFFITCKRHNIQTEYVCVACFIDCVGYRCSALQNVSFSSTIVIKLQCA